MARIGGRRSPALPSTDDQQARRAAILAAANRLGRIRELDRIAAQEIAADAGVALRTLYRYYPSKYHVFAGRAQRPGRRTRKPCRSRCDAPSTPPWRSAS